MRTLISTLAIASAFLVSSATAQAAGATQIWKCELVGKTRYDEVSQMAAEWLAAARKMKGGENLQAYAYFPVAVNLADKTDLLFIVHAPSFEEWGKFWDGYGDSPAGKIEDKYREKIDCPDSALWESVKVK